MSYIIDLNYYNVEVGNRLVILDSVDKTIYKKITMKQHDYYEIKYFDIIKEVKRYKLKFQKRDELSGKWLDITSYFFLVQEDRLRDYLNDNISISKIELNNLIFYFSKVKFNNAYRKLVRLFRNISESLWLNHQYHHRNLEQFLDFTNDNKDSLDTLWLNIHTYWSHLNLLKKLFIEKGYNKLYWNELRIKLSKDESLNDFLLEEINTLKETELQFAYILAAQYYSVLENRVEAEKLFNKAAEFDNSLGFDFLFGQGASTYTSTISLEQYKPSVEWVNDSNYDNSEKKQTILVSMDEMFLRNYGPQLFFNIIALKKYHLHVHLVSRERNSSIKLIVESLNLFESLIKYADKTSKIITPTFTFELVADEIPSIKTYSACARYIHADYFLERFKNNILILDADMFLIDDLKNYMTELKNYEIGIAFSKGLVTILPWRRVMAGNVYLNNSAVTVSFLKDVKAYILSNIHLEETWTLDQNALNFGYEELLKTNPNIPILNVYKVKTPISHPPIRKYIEEK